MYNQPEVALEQYGLTAERITRGRGAFICETQQGIKILSIYKGSEERAKFLKTILDYINQMGMETEQIQQTQNDGVISKDASGTEYILKSYCAGSESNPNDKEDTVGAVRKLAQLHNITAAYCEPIPEFMELEKSNLVKTQTKHKNELSKVRNFIRKKKRRADFEYGFLDLYPYYIEQAENSLKLMEKLWEQNNHKILCHGDYNYHNILKLSNNEYEIINFESCNLNTQLWDLSNYMRKILEKNSWDIFLGDIMLSEYTEHRNLNSNELKLLGAIMLFPYKYWKIANHYKNTNKPWLVPRDMEKLQSLIMQEENRKKYLKLIFNL